MALFFGRMILYYLTRCLINKVKNFNFSQEVEETEA